MIGNGLEYEEDLVFGELVLRYMPDTTFSVDGVEYRASWEHSGRYCRRPMIELLGPGSGGAAAQLCSNPPTDAEVAHWVRTGNDVRLARC